MDASIIDKLCNFSPIQQTYIFNVYRSNQNAKHFSISKNGVNTDFFTCMQQEQYMNQNQRNKILVNIRPNNPQKYKKIS